MTNAEISTLIARASVGWSTRSTTALLSDMAELSQHRVRNFDIHYSAIEHVLLCRGTGRELLPKEWRA